MGTTEPLDRAHDAFAERAWSDAFQRYQEADRRQPLEAGDLERWATAAHLSGHDAECTAAWTRAHESWRDCGDEARAVRCAFWLGFALVQRGDMATWPPGRHGSP